MSHNSPDLKDRETQGDLAISEEKSSELNRWSEERRSWILNCERKEVASEQQRKNND
jgi:hypothetical protein